MKDLVLISQVGDIKNEYFIIFYYKINCELTSDGYIVYI